MAWDFTVLKEKQFRIDDNKYWKLTLEEGKNNKLQISARIWSEGNYAGPTKSGFVLKTPNLQSYDDAIELFNNFIDFVKECKESINKGDV